MRIYSENDALARLGEGRLKLAAIALGCPKNTADLELMLGAGFAEGISIVPRLEDADVAVINTCSFLAEAITESEGEIAQALRLKRQGKLARVVVTGCYPAYLRNENIKPPEGVDAVLAPNEGWQLQVLLREWFPEFFSSESAPEPARMLTTPRSVAYVKIAEGCDMQCAFCIIPSLRGPYCSRRVAEILDEAQALLDAGVKELNLVSQDSTDFGKDTGSSLEELLIALCALPGRFWVRVQYLYPAKMRPALLKVYAAHPDKLIPYFDLPVQHIADSVLSRMRRAETQAQIRRLFADVRAMLPGASINANAIVGFPGETEDEFAELLRFVEEGNIDRLGVFTYSEMPGAPSEMLEGKIAPDLALQRKERLMLAQQQLSLAKHDALVGTGQIVLVDTRKTVCGKRIHVGRTYRDAYDVNGTVIVRGAPSKLEPGAFILARVTEALPYDLLAEYISDG
jgi:ribosomal protein S12 methylthiotransferase